MITIPLILQYITIVKFNSEREYRTNVEDGRLDGLIGKCRIKIRRSEQWTGNDKVYIDVHQFDYKKAREVLDQTSIVRTMSAKWDMTVGG